MHSGMINSASIPIMERLFYAPERDRDQDSPIVFGVLFRTDFFLHFTLGTHISYQNEIDHVKERCKRGRQAHGLGLSVEAARYDENQRKRGCEYEQ
jgi:hypothetical protein